MNTIGPIDLTDNLRMISDYPELFKDDVRDTYRREAMHEAATDKEQEFIDKTLADNFEIDSLLVDYVIDEQQEGFRELVKMAFNSNDETEIGRLFVKYVAAGFESYKSLLMED